MRIKSIEVNGFKSFADRTRLELHPGITCVVGPNGCGKSNVVDAFRWALGEQSAKNLRGAKMEEVIFSGTDQRKPKGMAQVDISLGGVARETPEGMPTDSITVSRRLFRSGESEYLINKNTCRLRDIRDIFLDTGLELRTYSILEQGKVGEIVNAKPADRRFLIEEVAGVVKYKVRKQEALSKLDSARNNLQRVKDIIGEVRRQLNSLDRQARKAERYKKMLDEFRELDLAVSGREYRERTNELRELARNIDALRDEEASRISSMETIETEIEETRIRLAEQENEVEGIQGRLHGQEKANTELQGRIDLFRQNVDNLRGRIADHERREEDLRQREAGLKEQAAEASRKLEALELSVSDARERLRAMEERIRDGENLVRETEENMEQARRELLSRSDEKSVIQNRLSVLARDQENIGARLIRASEEKAQVVAERDRHVQQLEGAEATLAERQNELDGRKRERDAVLQELHATRETLRSTEDEARRVREESVAASSRLASLEEMEKQFAGFGEGTRRIMEVGKAEFGVEVVGLLADYLRVPARFEGAIEAALGERLRTLILRDAPSVERAVNALKTLDAGGGAFIAGHLLEGSSRWDRADVQVSGEGVIGWASDLVETVGSEVAGVERLLDRVLVVEDLAAGLSRWGALGSVPGLAMVTLSGDVLESSGVAFTGGGPGLLGKKREIRELRETVEQVREQAATLGARVVELKQAAEEKEAALERTSVNMREGERELDEAQRQHELLKQEVARAEQRIRHLEGEEEQGRVELRALDGRVAEQKRSLDAAEEARAGAEKEITSVREDLASARERLDGLRGEGADIRVEYGSVQSELAAVSRELGSIRQSIGDTGARREALARERSEMEQRILETESARERAEGEQREGISRAAGFAGELDRARNSFNERFEALKGLEGEAKKHRPLLEDTREKLKRAEVRQAELTVFVNTLVQKILNDYDVRIEEQPAVEVPEGGEERRSELRQKMAAMGPVSLGALDEYQELEERHGFLEKQQNDLVDSIQSLEAAINKINRTTKERLKEAYAKLREKFQEVFRSLFGGGKADLVLVGEDILEAGLDIQVQPPGKRLQNITLLSGGEKALTALSILFAGFLIKPSPLCILDEVDAPLDESNTDRFALLLQEIAKEVQFVVITHNRRTMEAGDILYGATMEEPGVTKMVSMKMADYVEA